MGKYLHQKYDKQFNEDFGCRYHAKYEDWDEFEYEDNEYIPRIKGTKLMVGIGFLSSKCFPILTSRINDNKAKYYLFDFIKIWQTNLESYFTGHDNFY